MKFRTKISPLRLNFKIDYEQKLFFIGSCFAEEIGNKFRELKFQAEVNPFGVLYNPASIAKNIIEALGEIDSREDHIVKDERGVFHYDCHSSIHGQSSKETLRKVRELQHSVKKELCSCHFLFITLGSAFTYRLNSTGQIVANCHKQPGSLFTKEFLPVSETNNILRQLIDSLLRVNNDIQIIFTVSPIRHLSEGLVHNQRSKSSLICAVHDTVELYDQVHYFPAYEIMMDDLRDYRYYKHDLTHPNEVATSYIWEYLSDELFSEETKKAVKDINDLVKDISHQPLFPGSPSHIKFLENTLKKLKTHATTYPYISLNPEIDEIQNEIEKIRSTS